LGLASLFELPASTLQHLIAHGGWQQLQALLLQLLAAFENEKLVSEVAAGSAMTRQAQAVAALQQQLTGFLANCLAALVKQQQQRQQQVGDKQGDSVASLLTAYLDRVVEVSERAPTAAVLLQAIADATSQVASAAAAAAAGPSLSTGDTNSSSSSSSSSRGSSIRPNTVNRALCELGPQELLAHFSAVLAHVSYLHPAYMRPQIQRAVLQLVPLCCSAASCGAAVALSLLAASSNLQQNAAAAGGEVEDCIAWLDAALSAPAESAAAAAAAADGSLSQLQLWLQPLQQKSSSAAALPQLKLLHCLGLVSARLCDSSQLAIAAVLQDGAAAVAEGSTVVAAGVNDSIGPAGDATADATALACLACGVAVSLQTRTAAAAASDASRHDTPSAAAVAASLQQLLPALLRHHRTVHAAGLYSPTWVSWLTQLLQNVLHTPPASAAAAAADASQWQQLQTAVLGELTSWQQQLAADCAAAAASAELDRQLLLLSTSHMACYSLPCSTNQQSNHVAESLSAGELNSCLQSLCQLEPGSSFNDGWQAMAASSSSSVNRSEMTDALLELRLLLVAQLVAAAGAADTVLGSTQQLVFHR
jgi:hypothetical protein